MVAFLFAVTWGGTKYAWNSPLIMGLLAATAVLFSLLMVAEKRAAEPVLPLRLWRNRIFALSTIATALQATAQFGPTYFIPMFVQGVLGESATSAGAALLPLSITTMLTGIVSGQLIARTGRYKPLIAGGILCSAVGFFLLSRMDLATRPESIVINLILVGLGSGAAQNAFVLIVQNAVEYKDLGVATSAAQMFRQLGNTTGVAILSTTLTARLADEIPRRLPAEALAPGGVAESLNSGAVLEPTTLAQLPVDIVLPLREALAASLQTVNFSILVALTLAVCFTLAIKEIPLRRTTRWSRADESGVTTQQAAVEAGQ
jgi:MFS family permease